MQSNKDTLNKNCFMCDGNRFTIASNVNSFEVVVTDVVIESEH